LDQPDDPFGYVGDTAGHRRHWLEALPHRQGNHAFEQPRRFVVGRRLLCDAGGDLRTERKYRASILVAIPGVSSHNGTTQAHRTMMQALGFSLEAPADADRHRILALGACRSQQDLYEVEPP